MKLRTFNHVLIEILLIMLATLETQIIFMKYNIVQDWMFAPLANVKIAQLTGHWNFNLFSGSSSWLYKAINNFASTRFATPMLLLFMQQITNINALVLNMLPVNLVVLLFSLWFLIHIILQEDTNNSVSASIWSTIIVLSYYPLLNMFSSGHAIYGLILGYLVVGLIYKLLLSWKSSSKIALLLFLLIWISFKYYHTIAGVLFLVNLSILLIFSILSKNIGISVNYKSYWLLIIFMIILIIYDPLFLLTMRIADMFSVKYMISIIKSLISNNTFVSVYTTVLSFKGKLAIILFSAYIFIVSLIVILWISIKQKNSISTLINLTIQFSATLLFIAMFFATGRPRFTDFNYLLLPIFGVSIFQITQILKKKRYLLFLIILTLFVFNILASYVISNEPAYEALHTPPSVYSLSIWCSSNIQDKYFGDRKIATLVLYSNPYAKIHPLYFTFANITRASFIYTTNISQFSKGFKKYGFKFVVFGEHNFITKNKNGALLLPNVATMKGIAFRRFGISYQVDIIYNTKGSIVLHLS